MSRKQDAAAQKLATKRRRQKAIARARAAQAEQRCARAAQPPAPPAEEPVGPRKIRVTPTGRVNRGDAADVLGRKRRTLENWACKGVGPSFILVGGRAFYDYAELLAWRGSADGRTVQP
jgi:hypothetical protein